MWPSCVPLSDAYSAAVCPTVRYLRPTFAFDIVWPLTDAFALSYDPEPYPGNNCECNQYCTHQIACVILGSGYLVLEVLLPLLLAGLLASSLLVPVLKLITNALGLVGSVAYRVVDFVADRLLDPILDAILP